VSEQSYLDGIDLVQLELTQRLTAGQRIQRLLDARELAVGLIRGRLRRRYPEISARELNLKVLEELERVRDAPSGP
jgi:hypothetical protein